MTTTASAPPVQVTRAATNIDAAVALLSQPDGNLEDVAMLLRRLATADLDAISTIDPAARLQGLCAFIARRIREQYDDTIRTAPPTVLVELVRDASHRCIAPSCPESLPAWEGSTCDNEFCRREAHLTGSA